MTNRCLRAALFLAVTAATGACGAAVPAPNGPPLLVVASLYPLEQIAEAVGGNGARVVDAVPPGADPLVYHPTAGQSAEIRRAGLVLEVGGGFQPAVEAAARAAARVFSLRRALPSEGPGYAWLDPAAMVRAVGSIAAAMESADPGSVAAFRARATAYSQEISSTGIDYQSTLSTCTRTTLFTPDLAFFAVAGSYGLEDRALGTSPSAPPVEIERGVAQVIASQTATVFTEPWVADETVDAVAARAHTGLRALDTLLGPPPGGWPPGATYVALLESNLGALSAGLGCGGEPGA